MMETSGSFKIIIKKYVKYVQTRPKIIIEWPEYQIGNFLEKKMFSTLKAKTSSKLVMLPPDKICRFDPKFY
jgi:hypothetical protein